MAPLLAVRAAYERATPCKERLTVFIARSLAISVPDAWRARCRSERETHTPPDRADAEQRQREQRADAAGTPATRATTPSAARVIMTTSMIVLASAT